LVAGGVVLAIAAAWIAAAFFSQREAPSPLVPPLVDLGRIRPIEDRALGEIERGRAYYAQVCVPCHGVRGDGTGEWSHRVRPNPADLTRPGVAARSDAELYRIISDGIPGTAMRGWRRQLSDAQRWQIVAYVRQLGAGGGLRHE
jgi:mono/diheme cytochrome c family protein